MPDERTVGFSRILPQTRRLPVGDSPLAVAAKSTRQTALAQRMPSDWQTVVISIMVHVGR